MHELHLIKDLMNDILTLAKKENIKKISKIYIRMGDFSEINSEILKFYFEENGKNTITEGAVIDITKSKTRELRLLSFDCE